MGEWIANWITNTMESLGYLGIGLLMFLENIFPPIPSELIMPLAGFTASKGNMELAPAIAAGVIGTMLGALPWYYIGKLVGEVRLKQWLKHPYIKWLGISDNDIDRSKQWFYKHGTKTVLFCRMVPGIRTFISVPAGFSGMPLIPFLIYSTVGTLGWVLLLTFSGYWLGQKYELVDQYSGIVANVVLATLFVVFLVWLIRHNRKKNKS